MRGVVPNILFIFIKYNIIYTYIRALDAVTRGKNGRGTNTERLKKKKNESCVDVGLVA